ncbi:MAG: peptidoglycan-binding protein [Salinivirgaceae bacterium]|nr:MAG: peptidoglycan-binding protein [Salinivirgaceae bacterium]
MHKFIILAITLSIALSSIAQDKKVIRTKIGNVSEPVTAEVKLTLSERFQHVSSYTKSEHDHFDKSVYSPKSVQILEKKDKFYVNSLEGFSTGVYKLSEMKQSKVIHHHFNAQNANLFLDTFAFDYQFTTKKSSYNIFKGKPVEGCFTHNGKYLWVTYYRRSFDRNAIDPSAVAIIDTDKDEIVRVMPTGVLPKMIAASPDNKYVAVTHWGDNTIGLINIDSENPADFKYVKHLIVNKRIFPDYSSDKKVDRDHGCGYCLRGTVFTPDSKFLLVARMGGGGIAVFDVEQKKYIKTVFGMHRNLRHLVISNNFIYTGTNVAGFIDKVNLDEFIEFVLHGEGSTLDTWESVYIGVGVRTVVTSTDGKYIFGAVNNMSKVVVVRTRDMKKIAEIDADSFPVGMDINDSGDKLIVTSQGKSKYGGGNSVMVFDVEYLK